ncbi:membrane-binding protein [Pontibacter diazotrophicus]|uniref:Membrane-binding protein n=1 Tax=Pontibacter diazotrophicus TaxID=1400979 RepID=A0A3D8LFP8_9BACT|nr:membrane-binding protein [Pontibacter diazotrophicus]RDV16227.1 membrane-binding protein [Pontibacter diazotrophicus]
MINIKKFAVMMGLVLAPVLGQVATAATVAAPVTDVTAPADTRDIVQEIINVVGLKPRFELRAADIDNAAAVVYNGKRYILYSDSFLSKINNAVHTDWGGVSILAHEIGHHLNGHTMSRSGSNPEDELEADEFSGFVLRKMGASMADAQAAIDLLSEEENSRTHPGKRYRLAAISKGWKSANDQLLASAQGPQPDQRAIVPRTRPAAERQIASAQQQRPAATQRQAASTQRVSMDSRSVLTRVNFTKAPREQFYVTTRLNLVHMTEDGVRVIGKLAKTNNPDYPYYFQSKMMDTVFVTEEGYLVNKRGQRVGHLS